MGRWLAISPEESKFNDLAERVSNETGIAPKDLAAPMGIIQVGTGGKASPALYASIIQNAQKRGISESEYWNQGSAYATSQGAFSGTEEFGQRLDEFGQMDVAGRASQGGQASVRLGLAAQLQMHTGGVAQNAITLMDKFGLKNQTRVGMASSFIGAAEGMGEDVSTLAQAERVLSPFAGHSMAQQRADLSVMGFASGQGMSNAQATQLAIGMAGSGYSPMMQQGLASGNAYDWSQVARDNGGNAAFAPYEMYDAQGRRSGEASGWAVANFMQARDTGGYNQSQQSYLESQGMSASGLPPT